MTVPGLVSVDRLLHLHRLEDEDQVAGGYLLPVGDGDLDDGALHGGGEGVAGHGDGAPRPPPGALAGPGRRRRSAARPCPGGEAVRAA